MSASFRSHCRRCVARSPPMPPHVMRSTLFAKPSDFHGSFALFQRGLRTARADVFLFHSWRTYGPAEIIGPLSTSVSSGKLAGTAEKNGIEIRGMKSGATRLSVICSVWLPVVRTRARSSRNELAGDWSFWLTARSNARLKLAAVTAWPFENRKPFLIVIVYVLPPLETRGIPAAAIGAIRSLAGPFT